MIPDVCCKRLEPRSTSPFDIVMLGWQDGLTVGVSRCRSCGATYHFEMVAWDDEHNVRIYGLQEISKDSYDAIVALNAQPVAESQFQARADALTLRTRDALATSFERLLFIVSSDLEKSVLAARRIDFALWTEVLGL